MHEIKTKAKHFKKKGILEKLEASEAKLSILLGNQSVKKKKVSYIVLPNFY